MPLAQGDTNPVHVAQYNQAVAYWNQGFQAIQDAAGDPNAMTSAVFNLVSPAIQLFVLCGADEADQNYSDAKSVSLANGASEGDVAEIDRGYNAAVAALSGTPTPPSPPDAQAQLASAASTVQQSIESVQVAASALATVLPALQAASAALAASQAQGG